MRSSSIPEGLEARRAVIEVALPVVVAPRFFRCHAEGFDLEQLAAEADTLAALEGDAADVYGFDPGAVIAYGYSNGANIALASIVRNPGTYAGAILLRPALILDEPPAADLTGTPVLALLGNADAHRLQAEAAVAYLQYRGVEVRVERLAAGHDLTPDDGVAVAAWLRADGHPRRRRTPEPALRATDRTA